MLGWIKHIGLSWKVQLAPAFLIVVLIGLGASAMLARALSAIISGVSPRDPLTYAATAAAILALALGACYLPARRAASSDPVVLLRAE